MSKQQTNEAVIAASDKRKAVKAELERFIHRCGIRSTKSKKAREAINRAATAPLRAETPEERFARLEPVLFRGLGAQL